jgi:hypothetical protein
MHHDAPAHFVEPLWMNLDVLICQHSGNHFEHHEVEGTGASFITKWNKNKAEKWSTPAITLMPRFARTGVPPVV